MAGAGEAAPKKGGSKCWIIGCAILAVVVILGGIGTCLTSTYSLWRGYGVMQDAMQQFEEPGEAGGRAGEGPDDDGDSAHEDDTDDGDGAHHADEEDGDGAGEIEMPDLSNMDWGEMEGLSDEAREALEGAMAQMGEMAESEEWQEAMDNMAAAAPTVAAYQFFFALRAGDEDTLGDLVTDEVAAKLSTYLPKGDKMQVGLELEEQTQVSETEWEYVMRENVMPKSGGDQTKERRRIRMVKSDGEWLVSEIEVLD